MSLLNHGTVDLNALRRFSFFSSSSKESKETKSNTEVPKSNIEASENVEEAGKATGEAKDSGTDSGYRDSYCV